METLRAMALPTDRGRLLEVAAGTALSLPAGASLLGYGARPSPTVPLDR